MTHEKESFKFTILFDTPLGVAEDFVDLTVPPVRLELFLGKFGVGILLLMAFLFSFAVYFDVAVHCCL